MSRVSLPCLCLRMTEGWTLLNYFSLSFDQILPQMQVMGPVLAEKFMLVGSGSSYPPKEHFGVSPGERDLIQTLLPSLRDWTGSWASDEKHKQCPGTLSVINMGHTGLPQSCCCSDVQCCSKRCCPAAASFLLTAVARLCNSMKTTRPRASELPLHSLRAPPSTERTEYNKRAGTVSKLL